MSGRTRTSLLSLITIMVLVFSAASPIIAYADGGTTSVATPTEETSNPIETVTEGSSNEVASTEVAATPQPTDEAASTEITATPVPTEETAPTEVAATPVPTEEAASTDVTGDPQPTEPAASVEEESTATDPQSTEAAPPSPDLTILTEVPDNTAVTVLDANGQTQPLATQDAAEAIATSDPIWCPGNQSPTPEENGCTKSFDSFDALLIFLSGNPSYQGAGTIYVQQGAYQGNDPNKIINFNSPSYDLTNINNSNLTVTGGWNISSKTIDSTNPTTFSGYSIRIGSSANPWGGSLTISNIIVTGSPTSGIELHADGDVNMKDSKFIRNRTHGALIRARGNVNIANSSFSNSATPPRSQLVGLDIVSGGETSLFNVIAEANRLTGTNINAGGLVTIANSVFSNQKHAAIGNTSFFDTRLLVNSSGAVYSGYGLLVITPNAIAIDNVTANDNFLWGASLDAGGNIDIRNSVFNHNTTGVPGFIDDTGLIITGDAMVDLDNVTASDNRLYGALIDAVGTVTIKNSTFNNNRGVITTGGVTTLHGHGLKIKSLADISIDKTLADNNMLFGAQLNSGGGVAISESTFSNTSSDPGATVVGKGLDIVSNGSTSLANVELSNNQTIGANIQAGGNIFLDFVTASKNGTDGVAIQNTCTQVNSGVYSENGQYGLNLGNSALDQVSPPITFQNQAGDIFPVNPQICSAAVSVGSGSVSPAPSSNTPVVSGSTPGSSEFPNLFVGYFNSKTTGPDLSTENVSLNTYLADNTIGAASFFGVFTGRYAYIHSNDGLMYIVALLP